MFDPGPDPDLKRGLSCFYLQSHLKGFKYQLAGVEKYEIEGVWEDGKSKMIEVTLAVGDYKTQSVAVQVCVIEGTAFFQP